jgi:multiple sugar transport system permease protein
LGTPKAWFDRNFYAAVTIPGLVLVTAVTVVPIVFGLWLSFTSYQPIFPSLKWAGLVNYRDVLNGPDSYFAHAAIENTLIFVGGGITVETVLGVFVAVILARKMRGIVFFRALCVVPLMVSGVASAVTWRALLNTGDGWINYFLKGLGLGQPNWLGGAHTAMPSIILVDSWTGVPIIAIIVMAGILSLPIEPFEAALIDGASGIKSFWHITLPGIQPVLAFAIMFQMVNLFRQFAEFQLITGGGPGLATNVLNYYVYQETFVDGNLGYGAALAVVLVVMMAIPLVLLFRFARPGR